MAKNRTPKVAGSIPKTAGPRVPKAIAHLHAEVGAHDRPVFSFALADLADHTEWGWPHLTDAEAKALFDFICTISGSTWNQIWSMTGGGTETQHRLHHYQDISGLCNKAQTVLGGNRYAEMGGEIFRFRLGPTIRLWGFELKGMFYVVWWDPNHKVYPVN